MENLNTNQNNVIHSLEEKKTNSNLKNIIIILVFIILGTLTGFGMSALTKSKTTTQTTSSQSSTDTEAAAGIVDEKTFKDTAEGLLKEGGIDGEGQYHLERSGGESQNVYLTSSTVDLSKFVGKKVKVWGQTFTGEKAGWLMDVGLIKESK